LTANDETEDSFFGDSIALRDDVLVSDAELGLVPGGVEAGAAYVYRRVGNAWVTTAKLKAPDATPNDVFGGYVAIDGKTILIGAEGADGPAGANEGAACAFDLDGN